jgi:type I restriction enzyme, S subunit
VTALGQTRLGDFTEIVMGQAPPGSDCNKSGRGAVFVKAGEFNGRRPLIREWTTNPLKLARVGDVLVCVVGATAK